jgi:uncharacterized protein (TIGR02466 family)
MHALGRIDPPSCPGSIRAATAKRRAIVDGRSRPAMTTDGPQRSSRTSRFWRKSPFFNILPANHKGQRIGMPIDLKERQVIQLFPSCLFVGKATDLTLCDRVEAAVRAMQKDNQGSKDETFFMTRDDIHKRPEMAEFVELVMRESGAVLDFYKIKRASHYITDMWANVTNPNHRQALHIHPNCLLSGIMYIKAPPDCGPTQWSDPRPGARMIEPSVTEMTPFNTGQFLIGPEKGVMVIWPSFMPHAVERGKNRTHEDRIIVAFNVMIRGSIEISTAHLELK